MSRFAAIVLLLLLWNSPVTAGDSTAITSLHVAASRFADAMNGGNYALAAAMTHPRIVEAAGGTEMLIQKIEAMASANTRVMDMQFKPPGQIVSMPKGVASVVPYEATLHVSGEDYTLESFYIAWSPDVGETWFFADGNGAYQSGGLQFLFPGYTNELSIPNKKHPYKKLKSN